MKSIDGVSFEGCVPMSEAEWAAVRALRGFGLGLPSRLAFRRVVAWVAYRLTIIDAATLREVLMEDPTPESFEAERRR